MNDYTDSKKLKKVIQELVAAGYVRGNSTYMTTMNPDYQYQSWFGFFENQGERIIVEWRPWSDQVLTWRASKEE